MKFPRTLRLDTSDEKIFDCPAASGEWAVTGAFRFVNADLAKLDGKAVQAFKNAWFGLESFGASTLVEVAEIDADAYEALTRRLAAHFIESYGAPDALAAVEAAQEEMAFAASLCDHPPHTLLTLQREMTESQGLIEKVRVVVKSRAGDFSRVWDARPETD
ncbi:MAG: hypothetical protein HY057_04960 [Rhodospirillales bacterium]|nr:hypothetical protein [Rhodospirillales bacterium]